MRNRGLDLENTPKLAEASHPEIKAELSEDELANVSGGDAASKDAAKLYSACCTGKHIATGKIIT